MNQCILPVPLQQIHNNPIPYREVVNLSRDGEQGNMKNASSLQLFKHHSSDESDDGKLDHNFDFEQ